MIYKILCLLGLHKWVEEELEPDKKSQEKKMPMISEIRECKRCKKHQIKMLGKWMSI